MSQHMDALAIANQRRLAAAEAKNEVAAGTLTAAAALYDERAQSLTIMALLDAQHRWGRARSLRFLRSLDPFPLSENRRLRELTDRERGMIADALEWW